ncbi:MAG: SpoIIE family protein phosphatase [Acidobacteriota bacterium]
MSLEPATAVGQSALPTTRQTEEDLILVVDDTKANRDILRILLKREGYAIVEAADGREALEILERDDPDLVLLDIMMPGIDGFEVCERIKSNPATKDLPVIFLSALTQTEQKVKGLDLGAADYVTKPFDKSEVKARVRTHLELRRLNLSLAAANEVLRRQKEELDAELADAAIIQRSLLPAPSYSEKGLSVEWCIEPCASLGGDFVNIVPLAGKQVAIYLGDVSGHGVPSSLITMTVDRALTDDRALADADGVPRQPAEVLENLDSSYSARELEKHVTMFYCVVDLASWQVGYSSAAHPAAVLVRDGQVVSTHEEGGSVIGIGGMIPFDDAVLQMQPGDRLVAYTDGVTENQAPDGSFYGEERFYEFLARHARTPTAEVAPILLEELRAHRQDQPPQDDISIVILERETGNE